MSKKWKAIPLKISEFLLNKRKRRGKSTTSCIQLLKLRGKHQQLSQFVVVVCLKNNREIKITFPVSFPWVKNMWASLETTYTAALWPSLSLHNITHDWEPCQGNRCAKFQPPALQASFHLTALPPFLFFLLISFLSAYVSMHFFVVVFCCLAVCGRKLSSYGPFLRSAAMSAWDPTVRLCVREAESGGIKTGANHRITSCRR